MANSPAQSPKKAAPDEEALSPEQEEAMLALSGELAQSGMPESQAREIAQASAKALSSVSANKAVFPLREWEKKLSEIGNQGWLSDPKWKSMRSLIARNIGLVALAKSNSDNPWALYAPQRLMDLEREMIELAKRETDDHPIPPHLIEEAFASRPTMADEQKNATVASCTGRKAVVVTEGTAGAGKSFTLNAIREIYTKAPGRTPGEAEGYDIIGTALSWTATKVLEASAGLDPGSGVAIEGLTRKMDKAVAEGGDFFKRRTLLIVDEAGLVGIGHMHKLLWHAAHSKHPVRIMLTGDSLQLNPVMAGNALEAIVDECGSARLDTIRRQKQASHRAAVKHFCFGRAENGLWTFWQQEAIHFCENAETRREKVMQDYVRYACANPQKTPLVLALANEEVKTLNREIRLRLQQVGRLVGDEHEIKISDGRGSYKAKFCVGDQVVLRKNNAKHPVFKSSFAKLHEGLVKAREKGAAQAERGFFARALDGWRQDHDKKPDEVDRHGIFNRMNGIILDIRPHPEKRGEKILRLLLAEGGETEIDTSSYRDEEHNAVPLTHNFATTIYASQGQTVERVFMIDSPYMNRRLAYVGMSRHTELCDIYLDLSELRERMLKDAERRKDSALAARLSDPASISHSDYLQAAAIVWNKDSANPTPNMAKKHMLEKRQKSVKEGEGAWRPAKAPEDDADDHPEQRHAEPPLFSALAAQAGEAKPAKTKPVFPFFRKAAPKPAAPAAIALKETAESADLPAWASDPLPSSALESLRGKFWDSNRFGYPRLFSVEPSHGYPTARWDFSGALRAGEPDIPALPNSEHFRQAPWIVVPGAREALISWAHFRQKHQEHPEKSPNIAIAFPEADLSTLAKWVRPGSKPLYCAWSQKDPESLGKARALAERLRALGHKADVYPKPPEPSLAEADRRKAASPA